MIIAVINETSAAGRNADILRALEPTGHTILNVGMTEPGAPPELTYIETGFLAALLLYTGRVEYVVGGCGTGQGFVNSVLQYPGVFCGLVLEPSDALLFSRINAGNCVSLALNKGYGWAGEINLRFIFEQLFGALGEGYPAARAQVQAQSRARLSAVSVATHLPFADIVEALDEDLLRRALTFPGVAELLDVDTLVDRELGEVLGALYCVYENSDR